MPFLVTTLHFLASFLVVEMPFEPSSKAFAVCCMPPCTMDLAHLLRKQSCEMIVVETYTHNDKSDFSIMSYQTSIGMHSNKQSN
jgi:hypothetical protein